MAVAELSRAITATLSQPRQHIITQQDEGADDFEMAFKAPFR